MVGLILGLIAGLALLSWGWVKGIDDMKENHPDYKGEDWLNWDEKDHNDIF
jgi:hypothetical protein